MKQYIGYIRVSTVKQGEGVSLDAQREAILLYAERNHFFISLWLEELETAAKQGRPMFNQALKLLRGGEAQGIILHKLDRGARNLRDWAAIAELSDQGIEVHFVNESLDLTSRGGRLSADIQAVIAADYIRNLREETRKGFYGRLKQGLYPLQAPLGYVDQGKGKPKTIDPVMGPLVRRAFEMYGSAKYNYDVLGEEMHRLGLQNRNGGRVTRNGLSTMLNNQFYIGIIHIRKTNETFPGIHEPLIGKTLFDCVQAVLRGKINTRTQRHMFSFRRMLSCDKCKYSLVGERQKGHVYYRCHQKECAGTAIREELAEEKVAKLLLQLHFTDAERHYLKGKTLSMRKDWAVRKDETYKSLNLQLAQIKNRLTRLTDVYLDNGLDKTMFEMRKNALLLEQKIVEDNMAQLNQGNRIFPDQLEKFLELVDNAWLSHELAFPEEKREMVNILTSNLLVLRKKVDLKPSIPFLEIANRHQTSGCDPERDMPRMWDSIIDGLLKLNTLGKLPDLSTCPGFIQHKEADIHEAG